ncbi:hypothetical protein ONZ45_g18251 [Pleurotus djamor]|nr:hypothetical protein ONZ45_g18251 [Pleurotus djamor]
MQAIAMREMELWKDKIQLRIRDRIQSSMEQFSRECLEIDTESQSSPVHSDRPDLIVTASMDRVYSRAAKLVKRTLDVEGVVVMDVSHCEVLESLGSAEGSVSVVMHRGECVVGGGGTSASGGGSSGSGGMVAAATVHMTEQPSSVPIRDHWDDSGDSLGSSLRTPTASNTSDDDCVFIDSGGTSTPVTDSITSHPQPQPPCSLHPHPHLQHPHHPPQPHQHPQLQPSSTGTGPNETTLRSLTSDEYAQLVAYFAKHPDGKISEGIVPPALRPFLPTRIQYALTVPIFNIDKRPFALLCAYNTSEHTKRYILAAAELLEETQLSHDQASFLQTVQACGTSLVETVNHVLDFTKLSGNSKSGGVDKVIVPSKVDLMQLVEEAVDGCWIGYRARTQVTGDSGIGSVYSPPEKEGQGPGQARRCHVETVVDIGYREGGWVLRCDKGGIRRVLMNLFGNSLKFTSDGYVHVVLRQVPSGSADPSNSVKIELGVCDTGKGISQNFLKNQLFHPFSQENPLQTGTGLGLAIVNNIVHSDSVSGKVDVWSEVGLGTEIKVTFNAELVGDDAANSKPDFRFEDPIHRPTVVALGFDTSHNGVQLLYSVLEGYITKWWGFNMVKDEAPEAGDVVILNDDPSIVKNATERRDVTRPFLILSASRGNPALMTVASEHERIGGICRILYKPVGPSRLKAALKLCLHALHIVGSNQVDGHNISDPSLFPIPRRNSEETHNVHSTGPPRPVFPRSMTAHPGVLPSWKVLSPPMESEEPQEPEPETVGLTISVGLGGSLLKSSIGTLHSGSAVQHLRVLVVEDNSILRNLLIKWLKNKGYDYRDAVDGRDGVNMFVADGPFDVVLLDLSMPVLDGFGATSEIRQIEAARTQDGDCVSPTRILALTGMSSLEDKRRAFDAGVDGYLVKPVAFKTLDEMFHKLGFS